MLLVQAHEFGKERFNVHNWFRSLHHLYLIVRGKLNHLVLQLRISSRQNFFRKKPEDGARWYAASQDFVQFASNEFEAFGGLFFKDVSGYVVEVFLPLRWWELRVWGYFTELDVCGLEGHYRPAEVSVRESNNSVEEWLW